MNCVDICTNKHVRVNHKMMSVYMEVQPLIMQKRMEEMEKLNSPTEQPTPETLVGSENPSVSETPSVLETPIEQLSPDIPIEVNNSNEIPVASWWETCTM